MFFVYILQSDKDHKKYIGFTHNLEIRLDEPNSGLVKFTKNRRPLKLIYHEKFNGKSDALRREKEIKAKKGKFLIPQ